MHRLVGSVGEQEYAAGKQQSRLAVLSGMVDVNMYQCEREVALGFACSCRRPANIWIAQRLVHLHSALTLHLPCRLCMLSS